MKKSILSFLFFVLVVASSYAQKNADELFHMMDMEQDTVEKEQMKQKLLANYPESVYALVEGYDLLDSDDLLKKGNLILKKFPRSPWGYYITGLYNYYDANEPQKALHYFDDAARLDKDFWRAYVMMALVEVDKGEFKTAISHLDKAIALNPSNAVLFHYRGGCYDEMDSYNKAVKDYKKAVELNPKQAWALYDWAFVCYVQDKTEEGLELVDQAISVKQDETDFYYLRANLFIDLEKYDSAFKDYEQATFADSLYWRAFMMMGWVLANTQDADKAAYYFSKALEIEDDAEIYYYRGLTYYERNEYAPAEEDFTRAIERFYTTPDIYYYRGYCRYELGKNDDACADMKIAADLGDRDAKKMYRLNCK